MSRPLLRIEGLRVRLAPVSPVDAGRRVSELLEEVGLPARLAGAHPSRLSGGQRQRVSIARALAAEPAFLVCDEPFSALDPTSQVRLMDLFARLLGRVGVVLVSHDPEQVRALCDRALELSAGSVTRAGTVSEVLDGGAGL